MLTALAYTMVVVFMALIMTKRLPALVALILVPIAFGLIGGFGKDLGPMMLDGIKNLAPTGVMLTFAILYFGIMIDAGLFDPVVRKITKLVHGDPMKIVVGTTILAMFVSLDGDGSTSYMLTVTAMLPLYKRLGMSRLVLACVIMMAGGVFNILPWGGPTARAASALGVDPRDVFVPMLPAMAVAIVWVLFVAYMLGHARAQTYRHRRPGCARGEGRGRAFRDQARHRAAEAAVGQLRAHPRADGDADAGMLPLPVLFMIFFAIAIMINYPKLSDQKERIAAHAENVLPVVSLIFAAGIFVGILSGTKMVDAIAASVICGDPGLDGAVSRDHHRASRASPSPSSSRTTRSTSASCRSWRRRRRSTGSAPPRSGALRSSGSRCTC